MSTYLDRIVESTRARLEQSRGKVPVDILRERPTVREPSRDFLSAISRDGISLIAEIKRSSPSAGDIRPDADPVKVAAEYQRGGASAISVLTEPEFFQGDLTDLQAAKANCSLPILRKDFVIDPYQIVESRAAGADGVLLIVAAIADGDLLGSMVAAIKYSGMTDLVEVHDESEINTALKADASVIGINQRNLSTFEVDKGLAERLRPIVPPGVPVIAESGIDSRGDVVALEKAGLDGVLVGTSLMSSSDPAAKLSELLGRRLE